MQPLLCAKQMADADREAIQTFEIPELLLMEHAACALVDALSGQFGDLIPHSRGVVLAGIGNNGGDVLAAVRLLLERECQNVFVVLAGPEKQMSPSTQKQLALLAHLGVAWGRALPTELLETCDWVLDGLLGTGLSRPVEGEYRQKIEQLNGVAGRKWILSADIPSGLCADTGNPLPIAVQATATVTFGFFKRGLVTGEAAGYVGRLSLAPIQIPRSISSPDWDCFLYDKEDAYRLPMRRKDSHKGDFGRVAIIAGPSNREGAAALSALGALKTGAGLVTVYASEDTLATLRPRLAPEIMSDTLGPALYESLHPQNIVVGPGLGVDEKGWKTLEACLGCQSPLVADADALSLFAQREADALKILGARRRIPTVLTPHPREAARLLGISTEAVQKDRYTAVRALSEKWQCSVVLKGNGSLCSAPGEPIVAVRAGDSGLSKGGTGDVLSGILASFLAQGLSTAHAVPLSVFVHGKASELLTCRFGHTRSSMASEVAEAVADVLRELEWLGRA